MPILASSSNLGARTPRFYEAFTAFGDIAEKKTDSFPF